MTEQMLKELLDELIKSPIETECLEFKLNFHSAEEIGECISALSNAACIQNKANGYLVFGVEDSTHAIVGTTFRAKTHKKGSGVDKVIANNEAYHLPPINILVDDLRTTVTIYAYQKLSEMSRKDKINACYQHCCLQYMLNEKMTNQTLRERFDVEEKNYPEDNLMYANVMKTL